MNYSIRTRSNRFALRTALLSASVVLASSFGATSNLNAQQRAVSAQEYIQSTSPLAKGGSVTSRSAQGQNVQTVTTIAQLPSTSSMRSQVPTGFVQRTNNNQPNPNAQSSYPYPAQLRTGQTGSVASMARANSVMTRDGAIASTASTLNGNSLQTGNLQNASSGSQSPNPFLNAQVPTTQNANRQFANRQIAPLATTPNYQALRQSAYQVPANSAGQNYSAQNYRAQTNQAAVQAANQAPSLVGMVNSRLRVAQNCNCAPIAAYQPPAFNQNGVPNLNIQMPGQVAPQQSYQQGYQLQPTLGTPQFGAQGARWWTPFVTGSGVYSPLVKLQNLPPGTYLGQGIIGQPTAYVDGQWLRNLFRYIAP